MSETKDYSLLRPFDPDAAKRGEAVCWFSYGNNDDDIGKKLRLVGPSTSNRAGCFEWLEGEYAGTLETYSADNIRMSPLCWVEGRPVYRGDVLYQTIGSAAGNPYIADHFEDGMLVDDGATGCPHHYKPDLLTWTPPKVKREGWVNIYPRTGVGRVVNTSHAFETKHEADVMNGGNRIACVRIEWEEPAEVVK